MNNPTYIVNLFAGPGAGKSTLAAEFFAVMKQRGESIELVREYVKDWAWRGEKVRRWDQLYLLGKQLRKESTLYGKVDVIVTDCPLFMMAVYEDLYLGKEVVGPAVRQTLREQEAEGIYHVNCFVERSKAYVAKGRYETEEQAHRVDNHCRCMLKEYSQHPVSVYSCLDIYNALQLAKVNR